MRNIPEALATHLEQTSTTTCHAWRLTRTDGLLLGFTAKTETIQQNAGFGLCTVTIQCFNLQMNAGQITFTALCTDF